MKAVLVTYRGEETAFKDVVEIDDNHNFADGPYVDTIPFAVGSNQSIQPMELHPELS